MQFLYIIVVHIDERGRQAQAGRPSERARDRDNEQRPSFAPPFYTTVFKSCIKLNWNERKKSSN